MVTLCRCCCNCCRHDSALRQLVLSFFGDWPRRDWYMIPQEVCCDSERFDTTLAWFSGFSALVNDVRWRLSWTQTWPQFQHVSTISLNAPPHRWPTSGRITIVVGRQCRSPQINFTDHCCYCFPRPSPYPRPRPDCGCCCCSSSCCRCCPSRLVAKLRRAGGDARSV